MSVPLLSICIPTRNRAGFLRVMLEALLPQVAAAGRDVEVIVLDNASTDDTPAVLDASRALGPFRVVRQPMDLGPVENIIDGPSRHARGRWTWQAGDHTLLRPGALGRLLDVLHRAAAPDLCYLNFRCAGHPFHWPASALGGHDGPFLYTANDNFADALMDRWSDLVHGGRSALCTQMYAHVVPTALWKRYWHGRPRGPVYSSGAATYPHTWMLADAVFRDPVAVLGEPMFTIFHGVQHWSGFSLRSRVYLAGLPQLIGLFSARGLSATQFEEARSFCRDRILELMRDATGPGGMSPAQALLRSLAISAAAPTWVRECIMAAFRGLRIPGFRVLDALHGLLHRGAQTRAGSGIGGLLRDDPCAA